MRKLFFKYNCKTRNIIEDFKNSSCVIQIIPVLPDADKINFTDKVLYEYQKYHRYIREHRITGIKIKKSGNNIYLVKEG